MELVFVQHGEKFYAKTPGGEIAVSPSGKVYEWRDGERIDYTGGDYQCSGDGVMWTMHSQEGPSLRGFRAVLATARGGN